MSVQASNTPTQVLSSFTQKELASMTEVLKAGIEDGNSEKVRQTAHAILSRGQGLVATCAQRIDEEASGKKGERWELGFNPYSVVKDVANHFSNDNIAVEKCSTSRLISDARYLLARVLRVFSELTLLLSKQKLITIEQELVEDLVKKTDKEKGVLRKAIQHAKAIGHPGLKLELQCAKEAVLCWKSDDDFFTKFTPRFLDILIDVASVEGISDAVKGIRSLLQELPSKIEARWFRQAMSVSVIGQVAVTGDSEALKWIFERIKGPYDRLQGMTPHSTGKLDPKFIPDKKLLLDGVRVLADTAWRAPLGRQMEAMEGCTEARIRYPGLLHLATIAPKSTSHRVKGRLYAAAGKVVDRVTKSPSEHLADIRYHAYCHLYALTGHPSSLVARRARKALVDGYKTDQDSKVRELLSSKLKKSGTSYEVIPQATEGAYRSYGPREIPATWGKDDRADINELVPRVEGVIQGLQLQEAKIEERLIAIDEQLELAKERPFPGSAEADLRATRGLIEGLRDEYQASSRYMAEQIAQRLSNLEADNSHIGGKISSFHDELSFQVAQAQNELRRIIDRLQELGGLLGRVDRGVATLHERTAPKVETHRPGDLPPADFPGYIERAELQKALEKRLLSPREPITTCQGMGGVGKSSLARFVIHLETIKERYPVCLWFQSDTQEQLESQFEAYARHKKLIDDKAGPEEAIERVIAELETGEPYLMYFGNVADPTSLDKYRPGSKGHAFVTTRSSACSDSLVIETMTENEAVKLIEGALGDLSKKNRTDSRKLAREMGYHPFGLKQACDYIIKNETLTIAGFLKRRKSHSSAFVGWTSGASPKSLTTLLWQDTFDKLEGSPRQLLDQLAYMAPAKAIPMAEKKVLETLARYGLVQGSNDRYTIHCLLQRVLISKHLGNKSKSGHLRSATECWVKTYRAKLADQGARKTNKMLLPHGQALITHWHPNSKEASFKSLSAIVKFEGLFMTRCRNQLKSTYDQGREDIKGIIDVRNGWLLKPVYPYLTPIKAITTEPSVLDGSSITTKPPRTKPSSSGRDPGFGTTNAFVLRRPPNRLTILIRSWCRLRF